MGHEVYGTILRLGTSFTHTSENVNPHQIQLGSTGALKGWAAPRGDLDLNIGDRVRRIQYIPSGLDVYRSLGCLDILDELHGMHVGSLD